MARHRTRGGLTGAFQDFIEAHVTASPLFLRRLAEPVIPGHVHGFRRQTVGARAANVEARAALVSTGPSRRERAMTMSILVDGPPTISIDAGVALQANMVIPENAKGIVVFAHGSGSSRLSIRNRQVAEYLHQHGFATLLFDLLTPTEESVDAVTGHLRFDIPLLATRLGRVTDWLRFAPTTRHLPIAYFGASTGAAAALVAAAEREHVIRAVVSRGGRPDLARPYLSRVQAPTLLIVGGDDPEVLALNRVALRELASTHKKLSVVPGASHLFHEPGALEQVAKLASLWFNQFVAQTPAVALPVPSR